MIIIEAKNRLSKFKSKKIGILISILSSLCFIPAIIILMMCSAIDSAGNKIFVLGIAVAGFYLLLNSLMWLKLTRSEKVKKLLKIPLGFGIISFVCVAVVGLVFIDAKILKLLFLYLIFINFI